MKPIIVTAAIIVNDKKVLITQRPLESDGQSLLWEFPGGKLEDDENIEQCLLREIREEVDINIEIEDIFCVNDYNYSDRRILLITYLCRPLSLDIVPKQCIQYKWISLEDIDNYRFSGADMKTVNKLKESYGIFER